MIVVEAGFFCPPLVFQFLEARHASSRKSRCRGRLQEIKRFGEKMHERLFIYNAAFCVSGIRKAIRCALSTAQRGGPLNAHADVFHFHVVIHAVARSFAA
jgi:hypothetical protein